MFELREYTGNFFERLMFNASVLINAWGLRIIKDRGRIVNDCNA